MRLLLVVAATGCLVSTLTAQSPAGSTSGPEFDVVSIKPSAPLPPGSFPNFVNTQRPDGGFTMTRVPVAFLILLAYPVPGMSVPDIAGLPDWTTREFFDVSATSTLPKATPADRVAMMKAMLADRFKLAVHVESRPREVFELMLARGDRRLGSGLTPVDADCPAVTAARRAEAEAARAAGRAPEFRPPPPNQPPASCTLRSLTGRPNSSAGGTPTPPVTRLEGEATMAEVAAFLRLPTRRAVVDKTGLPGSYRVAMEFDMLSSMRGPDVAAVPDSGPDVFTAIQEQLGLKLQPVTAAADTVVVDRIERPTEN